MSQKNKKQRRRIPKRPLPCPGKCNVLLIGGGGREHALAWKIKQSPRLGKLWVTNPENPALAKIGNPCPAKMENTDRWRLTEWCDKADIHLVVIGPEIPLADGWADELTTETRMVFGVRKDAARIESDKAWAKTLMRSSAIPTAEARVFSDYEQACEYISSREDVPVIKTSGLAAGKGAIVPDSIENALEAVKSMMVDKAFGPAGSTIVVEEKLTGPEVSIIALVDGRNIYILETSQDHKRLNEGDTGPNTGGMGAYSPVPFVDNNLLKIIQRDILVPTVDALRREEIDYRGVLYAGLMITPAGPKVLEFNCRFGDPECQPLMMRMKADIIQVMWATATGTLDQVSIDWDKRSSCCIIMASPGYPGPYEKGIPITGIREAEELVEDHSIKVFQAGTRYNNDSQLVNGGGRVLGVTALGETIKDARDLALRACATVKFDSAQYRKDIAHAVL